jgi:predicted metalloenzyme YecM
MPVSCIVQLTNCVSMRTQPNGRQLEMKHGSWEHIEIEWPSEPVHCLHVVSVATDAAATNAALMPTE